MHPEIQAVERLRSLTKCARVLIKGYLADRFDNLIKIRNDQEMIIIHHSTELDTHFEAIVANLASSNVLQTSTEDELRMSLQSYKSATTDENQDLEHLTVVIGSDSAAFHVLYEVSDLDVFDAFLTLPRYFHRRGCQMQLFPKSSSSQAF